MEITDDLLKDFKDYTKISHESEDKFLKTLLLKSYLNIESRFGQFDLYNDLVGQDLVFARARYAYEDQLEFFNDNYRDDLLNFGLNNVIGRDTDENTI